MKKSPASLLLAAFILIGLTGCAHHDSILLQNKSNQTKAVTLLKSIETEEAGHISYINPYKYIQHNLTVTKDLEGIGDILASLPKGSAKVHVVRAFTDGDYVFTHTEYNFFGAKAGFNIFRFEDGMIVEHWDNLQSIVDETVSGRTQLDGPTKIVDRDKTEANKQLVKNLINDVFLGAAPEKITDYISTEKYDQHNPHIADGLDGLLDALQTLSKAGTPLVYTKNHMILGEGNFVLATSEGQFMNQHSAFYDLFRIKNGKVVEHWDTIETIPSIVARKNLNGKF